MSTHKIPRFIALMFAVAIAESISLCQCEGKEPFENQSRNIVDGGTAIPNSIANLLQDCRLTDAHALVVISGASEKAAQFIREYILDADNLPEVKAYRIKLFDGPESGSINENRDYIAKRDWWFPATDSILVAALDADGNELLECYEKLGLKEKMNDERIKIEALRESRSKSKIPN